MPAGTRPPVDARAHDIQVISHEQAFTSISTCPNSDHCSESARPAGSTGVAGVPGPHRRRLRGVGRLPEGARRSVVPRGRRRAHPQVRAATGGARRGRIPSRVRLLLAPDRADCRCGSGGARGSRSSRRATRRTPTGRSPGCTSRSACGSCTTSTTSIRRSSGRGSASRRGCPVTCSWRCSGGWNGGPTGRRTTSSPPTSPTGASRWSAADVPAAHGRPSSAAARPPRGCARSRAGPSCVTGATTCWSTSASWARRTGWIWCCG